MAFAVVLFGSLSIATNFIVNGAPLWMRIICPLLMGLFAYFLYWYSKTPEKEYMRAVKGQMSFQELKESVEAEEFGELIAGGADSESKEKAFSPLVSDNWLLLQVPGISKPVCIPKRKVSKVYAFGLVKNEVDENRGLCFLRFGLDDGKLFESGGVRISSDGAAVSALQVHFPNVEIDAQIVNFGKE